MEDRDIHKNNSSDPINDSHSYMDQRGFRLNLRSPDVKKLLSSQILSIATGIGTFYLLSQLFSVGTFSSLIASLAIGSVLAIRTTIQITSVTEKVSGHLELLGQKDISQFNLREKDYFKNIETPLNKVSMDLLELKKLKEPKSEVKRDFKVIDGEKKSA